MKRSFWIGEVIWNTNEPYPLEREHHHNTSCFGDDALCKRFSNSSLENIFSPAASSGSAFKSTQAPPRFSRCTSNHSQRDDDTTQQQRHGLKTVRKRALSHLCSCPALMVTVIVTHHHWNYYNHIQKMSNKLSYRWNVRRTLASATVGFDNHSTMMMKDKLLQKQQCWNFHLGSKINVGRRHLIRWRN
ncbi:hypothetical protein QTG54_007032 [Skeletonema marinoi]|uniref:Uncharacterized protein n=1 Tax=Skeletonema marinoi TaxID=267567 RepID=A0AAD9DCL0_9STRA|nr:hypothetical protein QTG54_007032 [Skeletonema marinoi]